MSVQGRHVATGSNEARATGLEALLLPRAGGFRGGSGATSADRRVLPQSTLQAYVDTAYRIHTELAPIVLRVGEPSAQLHAWHHAQGVCESVFVTAVNPFGMQVADAVNDEAMAALRQFLSEQGYRWVEGLGQGDDGEWPAEPSLLVPGGDAPLALRLCVLFRQNATVYIGCNGIPLIALHPEIDLEGAC